MSLESSRRDVLPTNIDKYRAHIITSWQFVSLTDKMYSQESSQSTINKSALDLAGRHLRHYFAKYNSLKVLEVFAGNCAAGNIIRKYLQPVSWMSTDIAKYNVQNTSFNKLDAVTAVQLFGPAADVLLMISPPFSETNDLTSIGINLNYGDYFACRDFIAQSGQDSSKYIVFIGELGASDGSTGMYQYMMTNAHLVLESRKMILSAKDVLGGKMEKEVFVFKLI